MRYLQPVTLGIILRDFSVDILSLLPQSLTHMHLCTRGIPRANRASVCDSKPLSKLEMRNLSAKKTRKINPKITLTEIVRLILSESSGRILSAIFGTRAHVRRSVYCTASFSVCSPRRTELPIIYADFRLDYKLATHPQVRPLVRISVNSS